MSQKSGQAAREGRPSTFTQEVADRICLELMGGKSLRSTCAGAGMPCPTTVYNWLVQYPAFMEHYARAREVQTDVLADEVITIADTEPDPHKARVMIDARKWLAGKLRPKKYGDRVEVEHLGGNGLSGGIVVNIIRHQPQAIEAEFVELPRLWEAGSQTPAKERASTPISR